MQTVSIFALVGASHCLLLAFISFMQSSPARAAEKLLAAILLIEGLRLYSMMALFEGWPLGLWNYPQLLRLAIGPLLYFYTLNLVGKSPASARSVYLHFVSIFVLSVLIMAKIRGLYTMPREYMTYLVAFCIGLMFIGYGRACLRLMNTHRQHLKRTHSAVEEINLRWLKGVCIYVIVMGGALLLSIIYLLAMPAAYSFGGTIVFSTITTMIFCYVISLKGIQQSAVYDRLLAEELERHDPRRRGAQNMAAPEPEKYESSGMTRAEAEHFYQLVLDVTVKEKLFLRPKLKLADLAGEVGLHPQQVSQVINQCANVHFCDFINNYRVQEAVKLLQEDDRHRRSILDIGALAGFNSPTTFYKYFRRQTGQSPKRYLREHAT